MNHRLLVASLTTLLVGSAASGLPGCNSSGGSVGSTGNGGADASSAEAGAGAGAGAGEASNEAAGSPGSQGGAGSAGPSGEAGAPGPGDPLAGAGAPASSAEPLSESTFLYVYSETADRDLLVARDLRTGEERLVADLRGDGSEGWEIWGHDISPDRRSIVIASLFGPTQEDVDTGIATRAIWTFDANGENFQRLTPVFENTGGGRTGFSISVQDPVFTGDGRDVIYDFGNWWYSGTTLEGGSLPWSVSTRGDDLPKPFPTNTGCSVIDPSVNPVTGDVLLIHSVCVNAEDEGIFLYPRGGGAAPTKLVDRGYGAGAVDPYLEKASWVADGSGFIFVGSIEVTRGTETDTALSLLAFAMGSGEAQPIVIPDADTSVRSATIAADGSAIVYCLAHDDVHDLHLIDYTVDPPADSPITNDGKSCSPQF